MPWHRRQLRVRMDGCVTVTGHVEVGPVGRTKWWAERSAACKTHWIDAAWVEASTPLILRLLGMVPRTITATGHGTRLMCVADRQACPVRHRSRVKRHFGFQSGSLVRAVVPAGLKTAGQHVGRVLVRASGNFDLATPTGRVQGIGHRHCEILTRNDGYTYASSNGGAAPPLRPEGGELPRRAFCERK